MPKVGPGARMGALVAGSFFILMSLGIWETAQQQLITADVAKTSLAADPPARATPAPSTSSPAAADRSVPVAVSQDPVDEVVAAEHQGFTGFTGRVRLTWTFEGFSYSAYLKTQQSGGFVRVTYDNGAGAWEEVDQDLVLRESENGPYYEGLNPRYALTQEPHPEYMPDYFHITQVDAEQWAFTNVCSTDVCVPVATTEVLP